MKEENEGPEYFERDKLVVWGWASILFVICLTVLVILVASSLWTWLSDLQHI